MYQALEKNECDVVWKKKCLQLLLGPGTNIRIHDLKMSTFDQKIKYGMQGIPLLNTTASTNFKVC